MSEPRLGRLEPAELRACWQSEASDFTPWLAEPENIQLLAEALGLPALQVEETEATVGPFRADILCSEPDSDGYVLIENQLERTDHRHLGQILTYAAGLDAVKVVWVSPDFTEEHRAALDWLNRISSEEFLFFGVQIELWRIGDSPMAPRFNLVVKPNEWAKQVKAGARAGTAEHAARSREYQQWWAGLLQYLEAADWPFRLLYDVPKSGSWSSVAGTPPCIRLVISHALKEQATRIYVLFRNALGKKTEEAREWFEFAHKRELEIAKAFPTTLRWTPEDELGYVTLECPDGGGQEAAYHWLVQTVPALEKAFGGVLADYQAGTSQDEER